MTENMHTSNIGDIFFISRALDLECPMKLVYNMTLFFFFYVFLFGLGSSIDGGKILSGFGKIGDFILECVL